MFGSFPPSGQFLFLYVLFLFLLQQAQSFLSLLATCTSWMNSMMNPLKGSFHAGLWCLGHVALAAEVLRHPASQDSLLPRCCRANGHVLPPATFREHPATEKFIIGEGKKAPVRFPCSCFCNVLTPQESRPTYTSVTAGAPPPDTHTE